MAESCSSYQFEDNLNNRNLPNGACIEEEERRAKQPCKYGPFQILCSGFLFAVGLSALIAMFFGFYYLITTYSLQALTITFGIFFAIWMISYFCTNSYDSYVSESRARVDRRTRGSTGPSFQPCYNQQQQHRNDCQKRFTPCAPSQLTQPRDAYDEQCASEKRNLERPCSSHGALNPGSSKLRGMCPPMPGSDKRCGPQNCDNRSQHESCEDFDNIIIEEQSETNISNNNSEIEMNGAGCNCADPGFDIYANYAPCGSGKGMAPMQPLPKMEKPRCIPPPTACNYVHRD